MLAAMTTDATLVMRYAAEGDKGAFRELVERHYEAAYRLAFRMLGDPAAADDATQEAFIGLLRGARRFDGERAFQPWFTTILLNAIRAEQRRQGTRARHEAAAAARRSSRRVERPDEASEARELEAQLRQLPTEQRAALVLHFYEGQSQAEVAARLGTSKTTAARRIREGIDAMRKSLVAAGLAGLAATLPARLEAAALEAPEIEVPPPQLSRLVAGAAQATASALLLQAGAAVLLIVGVSVGLYGFLVSDAEDAGQAARAVEAEAPRRAGRPRIVEPGESGLATLGRPGQAGRGGATRAQDKAAAPGEVAGAAPSAGEVGAKADEVASEDPVAGSPGRDGIVAYRWTDDMLKAIPRGERSKREHRIAASLACRLCDVSARELPLEDVLEAFAYEGDFQLEVDDELRRRWRRADARVSVKLRAVSLEQALILCLKSGGGAALEVDRDRLRVIPKDTKAQRSAAPRVVAPPPARRAELEALLEERKVSMDVSRAPLEDIVAFLTDTLGLDLIVSSHVKLDRKVSVTVKNKPLWEALDALARTAQLGWTIEGERLKLITLGEVYEVQAREDEAARDRERVLTALGATFVESRSNLDLAGLGRELTRQLGLSVRLDAPELESEALLRVRVGETARAALEQVKLLTGQSWRAELAGEAVTLVLPKPYAGAVTEALAELREDAGPLPARAGVSEAQARALELAEAKAAEATKARLREALRGGGEAAKALEASRLKLWKLQLALWLGADAQRLDEPFARPGFWLAVWRLERLMEGLGCETGEQAARALRAHMTLPRGLRPLEHPAASALAAVK